jgi:hypothetical protein
MAVKRNRAVSTRPTKKLNDRMFGLFERASKKTGAARDRHFAK